MEKAVEWRTLEEWRALLKTMRASVIEAQSLSKEEATKRLINEGFLDANGNLHPSYGGTQK